MDEENIDLLIKKRSEEIRKERLDTPLDQGAKPQVSKEEDPKTCVVQGDIDETIKTVNKVQKRSFLWKALVLVLVVALNLLWFRNVDLHKTIEALEKENLSMMDISTVHRYMDTPVGAEDFMILDDRQLINADMVMAHIDENIHYSNSGTRVYVPLKDVDYQLESPEATRYVKANIVDINIPTLIHEGISYLDFEFFRRVYNLEVMTSLDGGFVIYEKTYDKRAQVDSHQEFLVTTHGMNTLVLGGSELVDALILDEKDDMTLIMTGAGQFGYILSDSLKPARPLSLDLGLNQVREAFEPQEPIHLTWHQIYGFKNTPNLLNKDKLEGVTVISPTWFKLNINGIMLNESDFRYMDQAHDKDYFVWGLFSNDFKPAYTSDSLNTEVYRKKTIAQILFYASLYDLDGVNIDYENMYIEDKDAFTRFMAELSPLLKSQNIVLSVDVTVPGGSDRYSKVLDRTNLAKHVDYMMLMAYDEHWAASPISGPVASLPWVEKGLKATLEEVPQDKLLLGMPLYMRVWTESNGRVSSKAIGISKLEDFLKDKTYEKKYDADNGVNYLEYQEEGSVIKIWIEDTLSVSKRVDLAETYNLPGIATWSQIFATDEIWSLIDEKLKEW